MICESIVENIHDEAFREALESVESSTSAPAPASSPASLCIVDVPLADECLRQRVQRVRAEDGTELGIHLPTGHDPLRDGDVLARTDDCLYVVRVTSTDVLVITPATMHDMAVTAHSLGNRHIPSQFDETSMIVRYDHTVEHWLKHHSVPFVREWRVMPQPFAHAEHTH